MASEVTTINQVTDISNRQLLMSKAELRQNKKLRNAGLEYVSRTGRKVAAKKQQDELCNCPQRCADKIPADVKARLFSDFYKMGDHVTQNNFLQSYIEMRSVHKRLWSEEKRVGGRLQRRVSCKYRIPSEIPEEESAPDVDLPTPMDLTTPKRNVSKKRQGAMVEVCQKAFMNMYAITEKRIRLQREKLIYKSRYEAEQKRIDAEEMQTSVSVARDLAASMSVTADKRPPPLEQSEQTLLPLQMLTSIDHDITVVNNFFRNQLWKPEYIGIKSVPKFNNSVATTLCD